MSYTFAIVIPPIAESDAEAWTQLDGIVEAEGAAPEEFRKLYETLTAEYPCICSLPDEDVDDGVWSDGPLWDNFGKRAAMLGLVYSAVEEVFPSIVIHARSAGMAVFDEQTGIIHRPDGLVDFNLDIEDKGRHSAPTEGQVLAAVDQLMPDGGPGFLCIDRSSQDYVQAAGGNGQFTTEWREYVGGTFRHWVAGHPGKPNTKEVAIPANGFQVTVLENERLDADDAKAIIRAFLAGAPRPSAYAWRDITSRFQ